MAKWHNVYNNVENLVNFLCISVEGVQVANYFTQFVGSCINASVLPNLLPLFPIQLGCSGFIIINDDGKIVTTRTLPNFLDVGEEAFRQVENVINTLLPESTKVVSTSSSNIKNNFNSEPSQEVTLKSLPYTGHCEMDKEHARIDKCLQKLVPEATQSTVRELKCALMEHFAHEEEILVKMNFGTNTTSSISAFESHSMDHQLILRKIDHIIEEVKEEVFISIPQKDISKICNIIYEHGERFDSLYAEKVECMSCKQITKNMTC